MRNLVPFGARGQCSVDIASKNVSFVIDIRNDPMTSVSSSEPNRWVITIERGSGRRPPIEVASASFN